MYWQWSARRAEQHGANEIRSEAPALLWRPIIALRNYLIHAYWQIDLDIIADVIDHRIDPFLAELDALIAVVQSMDK